MCIAGCENIRRIHQTAVCMSQWGTRLALIQQPGWCAFVASTEFQSQLDKQMYDPENLYGRIHSQSNDFCDIIVFAHSVF
jgi:hypothetical protein